MPSLERTLLLRLLVLILRPAVRFCLRHSLKLPDLIECSKAAFVDAARREVEMGRKEINVSRMSVVTGVHRRDLKRFLEEGIEFDVDRDLIMKVIGLWRTDERFLTKAGEPRVLSANGESSEFFELCASVTRDVHPGTVLFELQRVKAVVPTKGGLRLVHESYVPKGDPAAGFSILSDDYSSLLDSVEENVLDPNPLPQFHARTIYDNVRPDAAPAIRKWFLIEGHQFHARVREFVSQFDQDVHPDPTFKGRGVKVVFGSHGNVESKKRKS